MTFLSLLLLTTLQAFSSQDPKDICQTYTFKDERRACLVYVSQHNFNGEAVQICANLTFKDQKWDCLNIIADKVYENWEINECKVETFVDDKLKCLGDFGYSVPRNCLSLRDVRSELQAVRLLMDSDIMTAKLRASDLLTRMNLCP